MHTDNTDIQQYIDKAVEEALHPQFEMTKKYLENNELELVDGLPKVERVDMSLPNGLVAVYLHFKQGFFLVVHLTKLPDIAVDFVYAESANDISFTATSAKLKYAELVKGLSLQPLTGWSKGDPTKNGLSNYLFSKMSFNPSISDSYDIESHLRLLLTELEKDAEAIIKLTQSARAYISVHRHQYVSSNAGIHFDAETIGRLAKLNLSVDIDNIIVGKPITEEMDEQ